MNRKKKCVTCDAPEGFTPKEIKKWKADVAKIRKEFDKSRKWFIRYKHLSKTPPLPRFVDMEEEFDE